MFVACRGATPRSKDGHAFLEAALRQGATALVVEDTAAVPGTWASAGGPAVFEAADSRVAAARLAERLGGEPSRSLDLIGITGTNGKTTVAFLLADLLNALSRPCSMFGTLGVGRRGALRPLGFTTPEAEVISDELRQLVAAGERAVAMEVSSHALATERVAGLSFRVAAFTNLTQDHLDFHGSMEAYFEAKARLFEERLGSDGVAVLPDVDDPWAAALRRSCPGALLWGRSERARVRLLEATSLASGMTLRVSLDGAVHEVTVPLLGAPNVDNLLCVAACGLALGLSAGEVAQGLGAARPVPGRFQPVQGGGGARPVVVVDYAHTPDALSRLLAASRELATGRVIVVFGCGGDRDARKRPVMGRVASEGADVILLTDDNPRSEDPAAIVSAIEEGLAPGWTKVEPGALTSGCYARVHDRRAAIAGAIGCAAAEDVVVIAGKGHESTQTYGDRALPFDDASVARALLGGAP